MSTAAPDNERRLIPRWHSSDQAIASGELRSPKPGTGYVRESLTVPRFDEALAAWNSDRSIESASELVSAAIVLGRANEVSGAATMLADAGSDTSVTMREMAIRALDGTLSSLSRTSEIGFQPNEIKIHTAIAAYKRRLRLYPTDSVAWVDLARLYTIIGQLKPARRAIEIAVAREPNNRFIVRSSARFFAHLNQPDDLDRGLNAVRRSRALRTDPWLMAAEISLSMVARVTPISIMRARQLSESDGIDPWDSSELNGALASFAIDHGGFGKPSKLFKKSLRSPTENTVAQAEWAANQHRAVQVPITLLERPGVFEALALHYRGQRQWNLVVDACRKWSALEPTSSRPMAAGSFVALAALENGEMALEFVNRAALSKPNDFLVLNDRTVALAYLGRLAQAQTEFNRIKPHDLSEVNETAYLATGGLLKYRSGQRSEGFALYMQAMATKVSRERPDIRAIVAWHLLREEAHFGAPDAVALADQLWNQTKNISMPEIAAMNALIRTYPRGGHPLDQQLTSSKVRSVILETNY